MACLQGVFDVKVLSRACAFRYVALDVRSAAGAASCQNAGNLCLSGERFVSWLPPPGLVAAEYRSRNERNRLSKGLRCLTGMCYAFRIESMPKGGLTVASHTFTIAICDDEPYFLDLLQSGVRERLSELGLAAGIQTFSTGEDLLFANHGFDIVLMDIKLPGKNGLEIIAELQNTYPGSQIIFISSYQEYAVQAFDLDAVHYCLKPVSRQALAHALDKAIKSAQESDCITLTIAKGNQTQRVYLRDILFCEAIDHRIYIHTEHARYDYFGTLDTLQGKLDDRFFRCHKSYLVNLTAVIRKERDMAILTGGNRVLVSRRKQQELTQKLLAVFRREVL